MDGIHDFGGMDGFGPVRATHEKDGFAELQDWEKRMWALSQVVSVKGANIDWFRHVVELMVPKDYLTYAYFNKWCTTIMTQMIDEGIASLSDFERAKGASVDFKNAPADPSAVTAIVEQNRNSVKTFEVASDALPKFAVGQSVRTLRNMHKGHTRLPRYARDVEGEVIAQRGSHPLPDKAAHGVEHNEHLYTVRFSARELWGPDANPLDSVTLDLWESYLVST